MAKFKTAYSNDHVVYSQDLSRVEEPILAEVVELEFNEGLDDSGNPIRIAKEHLVIKEIGKRNIQEEINASAIGCSVYEILARTNGEVPTANGTFGNIADSPKDLLEAVELNKNIDQALDDYKGAYSSIEELLNDVSNKKLQAYLDAKLAELKVKEGDSHE
ncbi:hypothetical protein [Capybara microvirus Cap3_SP_444]|nr:hypothetical protein [Capybara microvirus Cap3_SP_444]